MELKTWGDCVERAKDEIEAMEKRPESLLEWEALVLHIAESRALENLVVMPHWTGMYTCDKCGYMPAPPGVNEVVKACPWCHSTVCDYRNVKPYGHVKLKLLLTGESA